MATESFSSKRSAVEVFSFDCPLCEDIVQAIKGAAAPCGCALVVRGDNGPREVQASEGGLSPTPSVALDGLVVSFDGFPKPRDRRIPSEEA